MSNGNSHLVSRNGLAGNDFFDVLRNQATADSNGISGDDSFVVRSFVQIISEDGSLSNSSGTEEVRLSGEEGNDFYEVVGYEGQVLHAFVVNSLVDVDGGTGFDRYVEE